MEYAIIGEKLAHSFSKEIYAPYFGLDYSVKELKPDEVAEFLKAKEFKGINVTIPYKQTVIPYLDEISDVAKKIGAVNVIVNDNGKLKGYNTDFSGLKANIENVGVDLKGKEVLILGDGGTSKNAYAVAEVCGAKSINIVSLEKRADTITYEEAKNRPQTQVIINTTPVGMYPKIDAMIIDLDDFPNLEGLFDAVYNPLCSKLVVKARKREINAHGGLYMLVSQAIFAVEKFKNEEFSQKMANGIFKNIYKSKENVVLIGENATVIGEILAEKLNREFIADKDVINMCALQSKVLAICEGTVLNEEDVDFLKLNSKIYFMGSDCQNCFDAYNKRIIPRSTYEDTADLILKDFKD